MPTLWSTLEMMAAEGKLAASVSPTKQLADSMSKTNGEEVDTPTKNAKKMLKTSSKGMKTTKLVKKMSKTVSKSGKLS